MTYDPDHAVKCPVGECDVPGFKNRQAVFVHLSKGHKLGAASVQLADQAAAEADTARFAAEVGEGIDAPPRDPAAKAAEAVGADPAMMAPEDLAKHIGGILAEYPELKRSAARADRLEAWHARIQRALNTFTAEVQRAMLD